jgi:hypothetical protein
MRARFCLSFQTNSNRVQDILVVQGQRLVQQPLRGGDLGTRRICHFLHSPPVDRQLN